MEKLKTSQLSNIGLKCYKLEKQETMEFKLPVELTFTDAKRLMSYSEKIADALEIIKDEKKSNAEKERAVKDLKVLHGNISAFVLKRKQCFEARKVLIMCEMMMLEQGIDPKQINNVDFDAYPDDDNQ